MLSAFGTHIHAAATVDGRDRFRHRNGLLGRESTPEALAFLSQPGSWF